MKKQRNADVKNAVYMHDNYHCSHYIGTENKYCGNEVGVIYAPSSTDCFYLMRDVGHFSHNQQHERKINTRSG